MTHEEMEAEIKKLKKEHATKSYVYFACFGTFVECLIVVFLVALSITP